jgi:hypothetical protein
MKVKLTALVYGIITTLSTVEASILELKHRTLYPSLNLALSVPTYHYLY